MFAPFGPTMRTPSAAAIEVVGCGTVVVVASVVVVGIVVGIVVVSSTTGVVSWHGFRWEGRRRRDLGELGRLAIVVPGECERDQADDERNHEPDGDAEDERPAAIGGRQVTAHRWNWAARRIPPPPARVTGIALVGIDDGSGVPLVGGIAVVGGVVGLGGGVPGGGAVAPPPYAGFPQGSGSSSDMASSSVHGAATDLTTRGSARRGTPCRHAVS